MVRVAASRTSGKRQWHRLHPRQRGRLGRWPRRWPHNALKQACFGAQKDRLLLVQYEALTTYPARTMQAIYGFIGEQVFEHDFDNIDYDVAEFDERAGTPGLHTVGKTVNAEQRESLLPPDLFNRFVNDAFWREPNGLPEGLRIV